MKWRYRDTVLALCTLAFFVSFFARVAISPVVPLIRDDFAVSNSTIGIALSGMWVAYGVTQFPSGVLADRYGEKSIILLALGGTAVTSLLAALSPGLVVFAVAVVLLGCFAGLHYSVASTLITRIYDDIGTALGVHTMGGPLAGLVAPVAAAWIGFRFGWRPVVALSAVVAVPIFLLYLWRVRPTEPRRPDQPMRERFELGAIFQIIRRPPIAFSLVVALSATYVTTGLNTFIPTFLVEYQEQSPTVAGALFSLFYVVRGGAQLGVGAIADRFGRDVGLGLCMAFGVAGFAVSVFGSGLFPVTVGVLLLGLGASYFGALEPRFMDALTDAERGAGFGLVRTIYVVIAASGAFGVGLFADLYGWDVSFLVLLVILAAVLALLVTNKLLDLGY